MDQARKNKHGAYRNILDLLINAENEGRLAKYSTSLLRRNGSEFTVVSAKKQTVNGIPLNGQSSAASPFFVFNLKLTSPRFSNVSRQSVSHMRILPIDAERHSHRRYFCLFWKHVGTTGCEETH